jgi:hypothetical protein
MIAAMARLRNVVIPAGLLALAGCLAIYAAWAYVQVQGTIQAAVDAGQLTLAGSEFDIASFYMTSSGQYAVFAIMLAALAWLILRRPVEAVRPAVPRRGVNRAPSEDDDDLDDLLDAAFEGDPGDPDRRS